MAGDMSVRKLRAELHAQEFFSVPETATLLRMDERTVRKMLIAGEIPGTMLRKRWRIPTWWLRQQAIPPGRAA